MVWAFLAGADAFCCTSMCEMPRDAWGDGRAMAGRGGRAWAPAQLAGQGTRHGETIPIPYFESYLHLASFVSRADTSE